MRKNLLNQVILLFSVIGFIWAIWQHELLVLLSVNTLWNTDFAFFWGIHTIWGMAYDLTLLTLFVCFISGILSIWFWKE